MNARQKAKHYKRLYERCKATVPIHIVDESKLNHIKAKHMIPKDYLISCCMHDGVEAVRGEIVNNLMYQLKPYIQESMMCETDEYTGNNVYTADIWLRQLGGI